VRTLERALKQLYNKLHVIEKRRKAIKLVLASAAVIFLCVILSGLIIANVSSVYQTSSTISSVGTLKAIGIGVYWSEGLTSKVNEIEWGSLTPGSQKSYDIYIHNEGIVPLTLSISASNWNPSNAANYMTLTWNSDNHAISTGSTSKVTLTLTVSPNITGISSFNFDINAVASR
jgi:hypothetical protein